MIPNIILHALTPTSILDRAHGRQLLLMMRQVAPLLYPQKYGNFEPLRNTATPDNVDDILGAWSSPFLWQGGSSASGSVFMGNPRAHDAITITTAAPSEQTELVQLLKTVARSFHCDFGYLHQFSEAEIEAVAYEMRHSVELGVSTFDLARNVPYLAWATVFGSPYIELIGRERLFSCPAAVVEEVADNVVYVQLTPGLADTQADFETFRAVQATVKAHLGEDLFMRDATGRIPIQPTRSYEGLQAQISAKFLDGGAYRRPTFNLQTRSTVRD
jgi:hypothetical protein